ncbi:MAG: FAD-dependent oxidoreductase [Pseudomonadota bacterium]
MTTPGLSRRRMLALLAGSAACLHLPLKPALADRSLEIAAALRQLPADLGNGYRVAVVGAGLGGLTTAWHLARAGFDVTVLEAEGRYGGRSLTVRPTAPEYRAYFKDYYGISEATYVDRFAEVDGPEQLCTFFDDGWDPERTEHPQELFLNAGPGRIPSFHVAVLELCQEIGVELEPFIFMSRSNLIQSDAFNGGDPVQIRQVKHNLRGELAEYLTRMHDSGAFEERFGDGKHEVFRKFLINFGDLTEKDGKPVYKPTARSGYEVNPGAWQNPGKLNPVFDLDDMLASELWIEDPETGSLSYFHYNDMREYWQSSLMQPKGGMDMIWQHLLRQEVPGGTVMDLVTLEAPVSRIAEAGGGGMAVSWTKDGVEQTEVFDFCVSSMAPNLLANVLDGFDSSFTNALGAVDQTAACKVGWQGKTRFWEEEEEIFGGISWTHDIISQIWYPADGYLGRTGTLTGAYNRGDPALKFGDMSHDERLKAAIDGGEKLHPGFADKVHTDRGVSIAWAKMPHQVAGWADETFETQPDIYKIITQLPRGRLYLAGDFVSYMPGWMEGAVRSAQLSSQGIAERVSAGEAPVAR